MRSRHACFKRQLRETTDGCCMPSKQQCGSYRLSSNTSEEVSKTSENRKSRSRRPEKADHRGKDACRVQAPKFSGARRDVSPPGLLFGGGEDSVLFSLCAVSAGTFVVCVYGQRVKHLMLTDRAAAVEQLALFSSIQQYAILSLKRAEVEPDWQSLSIPITFHW